MRGAGSVAAAMAHASDPELLVLLGLRLASFAPPARIAELTGLPEATVREHLPGLAEQQLARERTGRVAGWSLLPAGRVEGERLLAAELDAQGLRGDVDACYRRFLALNRPLLTACTEWQLRTDPVTGAQAINEHDDPVHDANVLAGLGVIDDEIQPVCAELALLLARFANYGHRLAHARAEVDAGETDWFTKPSIDSYHTVWFELHEHLLATLGIERAGEVT